MVRLRFLMLAVTYLAGIFTIASQAKEPQTLQDVIAAWTNSVDTERPLWLQFDESWERKAGLESDPGFQLYGKADEHFTYIYDPPLYLKRYELYHDGKFVFESVHAANTDYSFELFRNSKSARYDLRWLGLGQGLKQMGEEIATFTEYAQRWNLSQGASFLPDIMAKYPEAFELKQPTDGQASFQVLFRRDRAKDRFGLGRFADYSEGQLILAPNAPWLPVSWKLRFDSEREDFNEERDFDVAGGKRTTETATLEGIPMALIESVFDFRGKNDEWLALTRLGAYGIPEPELPTFFAGRTLLLCVIGLLFVAVGYRFVKYRAR